MRIGQALSEAIEILRLAYGYMCYLPKRISAKANSSNASLKLISSKTIGLGVMQLPSQCCHRWLKLRIARALNDARHQTTLATHYISVSRICQGGKPWNSNGAWLCGKRLMGWIIMKSGEENPSTLAKPVSRTNGTRGRAYPQAKYSLCSPPRKNRWLLELFVHLSLSCVWYQDTETGLGLLFLS